MVKWRPSRGRYISRVVQAAKKINPQEAEQTGKKLVDASKNVNRGKRTRIGAAPVEPQVEQVFVPKTVTIQEPTGFKPYYIGGPNPNPVLSADQNQARLDQINRSITDLGQHLKRMEDVYGIKTPAAHKAAMYRAVRTNPQATMAPPEGPFKLPYRTWYRTGEPVITDVDGKPIMTAEQSPIMVEGETMKDWYDAVGEGVLPQGPNASWRKLEIPFQQATQSFDIAGQQGVIGQPAYSLTMRKLGEGLEGLASKYLGTEPLQVKQIQIRKPYITPNTSVTINPEYLAHQAAVKDMNDSGIKVDSRLENWFIPNDKFSNDWGIESNIDNYGVYSYPTQHYSTRGLTTRGRMYGEDLESGLGDLQIHGYAEPKIIQTEQYDVFRDPRITYRDIQMKLIEAQKAHNKSDVDYYTRYLNRIENAMRDVSNKYNVPLNWFKQGGVLSAKSGIHIKKANRGKFTDYCGGKVTSACIAKGKASSNPTIRKRATFAANARKWKHQNGGKIIPFWVHDILGGE